MVLGSSTSTPNQEVKKEDSVAEQWLQWPGVLCLSSIAQRGPLMQRRPS